MGILDKIKDVRAMQQQANQIKALLSQEEVIGSSSGGGVTITADGNQNVTSIAISDKLVPDRDTRIAVAGAVKEAMANFFKEHQKMVQKKLGGMLQ